MKKCLYCHEEIQDIAKKCRFCGEWLEKVDVDTIQHKNNLTASNNNLIKKYGNFIKNTFSGRVGRGDYFAGDVLLLLAMFLIIAAFIVVVDLLTPEGFVDQILIFSLITAFLGLLNIFIVWIGLNVRRLHDINYSGWALLLGFIPLLNFIIGLMALFKAGNSNKNKYGDVPNENKFLLKRILNIN
jgi:uncharacterized membrane protein YhaH (DUF805 family)